MLKMKIALRHLAAVLGVVLPLAGAVLPSTASAQDYPNRPIRLVVPFAPGGNVDITARAIAPALGEALGQQIIVDNRAGGGGFIGAAFAAKSAADGYTLLLGSSGTISVAPAVAKNPPYDPIRDLVNLGPIHAVPIVLTVGAKSSIMNFRDFVAQAQAKPGQLSMASAGTGTSNHLAIELLAREAKLKMIHVPYKGAGPAITDVIGGQVEAMMDQLTASIGHIKEGRLRALAVTTKKRSVLLPDVPTLAELGLTNYDVITFTGLFAPAGTPRAVSDKVGAALKRALANAQVKERFAALGVDVIDLEQSAFDAYVKRDFDNWRSVAREAGISLEQ
jgi:tripartite-type tricarboxylate transporter receptor subunit TctC